MQLHMQNIYLENRCIYIPSLSMMITDVDSGWSKISSSVVSREAVNLSLLSKISSSWMKISTHWVLPSPAGGSKMSSWLTEEKSAPAAGTWKYIHEVEILSHKVYILITICSVIRGRKSDNYSSLNGSHGDEDTYTEDGTSLSGARDHLFKANCNFFKKRDIRHL